MPYCEVIKPVNHWVEAEPGSPGVVAGRLRKVRVGEQVEIPAKVMAEFHDRFVLAQRPTVHAPSAERPRPEGALAVRTLDIKPKREATGVFALNKLCKEKLGKGFRPGTPKETMIAALTAAGHEVPGASPGASNADHAE